MSSLDRDYLHCKRIIKQHSKSFYWAFRRLPKEKANAVWAIYAFCRRLDDAVDEGDSTGEFDRLVTQWQVLRQGEVPDEPVWRALGDVFRRYNPSVEPYEGMIEGQRSDLAFAQPETDEELLQYCSLVAGTVGRMLLPVLATEHQSELADTANQLGQAMQLTNILRDVGEDLCRGRVYFSREAMERFGVTEAILAEGKPTSAFMALWEHYAVMAGQLYQQALENLGLYDRDSRAAVRGAAMVYGAILDEIRRRGYPCLTERVSLTLTLKLLILARRNPYEQSVGNSHFAAVRGADTGRGHGTEQEG